MTPHAVFVVLQVLVFLQETSRAAIMIPPSDSFLASASSESGHHAAASSTGAVQQSPAPQAPTEAEQIARATEILRGETIERVKGSPPTLRTEPDEPIARATEILREHGETISEAELWKEELGILSTSDDMELVFPEFVKGLDLPVREPREGPSRSFLRVAL